MTAPVRQSGRWMPTGADHLQDGSKAVLPGIGWRDMGDGGGCISLLVKSWSGQLSGSVACKYEVHEVTGPSIDAPLLIKKLLEGES